MAFDPGGQLSGGEQHMLAIARAIVTNPRLLILDEATEGLAPLVREEIWRVHGTLREAGWCGAAAQPRSMSAAACGQANWASESRADRLDQDLLQSCSDGSVTLPARPLNHYRGLGRTGTGRVLAHQSPLNPRDR